MINSAASQVRLDFYNHYATRRCQGDGDTTTLTITAATRGDFAYLGGRTLLQFIFAVAIIGPTVIFDCGKSLNDGKFNFKQTRIVAEKILTSAVIIALHVTGILFPKMINKNLLEIEGDTWSFTCRPSQAERDALNQAGAENHTLEPEVVINDAWMPNDQYNPYILRFNVVAR